MKILEQGKKYFFIFFTALAISACIDTSYDTVNPRYTAKGLAEEWRQNMQYYDNDNEYNYPFYQPPVNVAPAGNSQGFRHPPQGQYPHRSMPSSNDEDYTPYGYPKYTPEEDNAYPPSTSSGDSDENYVYPLYWEH